MWTIREDVPQGDIEKMKTAAAMAMPHTAYDDAWSRTRIDSCISLDMTTDDSATRRRRDVHFHPSFVRFSATVWTVEISAVLLTIADLVIIVLVTAFEAAVGLCKDSHSSAMLEEKTKTSVDDPSKRGVRASTMVQTKHYGTGGPS